MHERPPRTPTELEETSSKFADDELRDVDSSSQTYSKEQSDREDDRPKRRIVKFEQQLANNKIPPDSPKSLSSSSSSSSSSSDEEEPETKEVTTGMGNLRMNDSKSNEGVVEISGQFLRKDEKVLVEIGGQFHVVEAGEIEKNLPLVEDAQQSEDRVVLPPVKPPHPRSAPAKSTQRTQDLRSASATPDYFKLKNTPTFSYSEETKKLIRRQAALRAKREAEELARRKEEENLAREEADEAWKSWVEKKKKDIRDKKKQEEAERKRIEREKMKDPVEIEEAYSSWMKQKMTQIKKERIIVQQQQIEHDEGWYLRERRDCNKAFRLWLRNKNEMARKAKVHESRVRKQSIREMRRARKEQKLMEKIREAQQLKYVDYYGYRI